MWYNFYADECGIDGAGVKVGQRVHWEGQQVISGDYHDDTTLGFCLDSPLIIVTWSAGKTISRRSRRQV